jgi:branched-chain amino acid transport system substrate-binding protein
MDGNVRYGMAAAYTFVPALFKAGRNPTRQDLVNAVNAGLPQGVSVAPYAYSATDHDGITGAYIAEIENGVITPIGSVQVTDTTSTGPVTTSTAQPPAPSSGIP